MRKLKKIADCTMTLLPEYEINEAGIMVICKACDRYLKLLSEDKKIDSIISDERIMIE